eukprot:11165793-Lingulodinium_polyedra.AAC.1
MRIPCPLPHVGGWRPQENGEPTLASNEDGASAGAGKQTGENDGAEVCALGESDCLERPDQRS